MYYYLQIYLYDMCDSVLWSIVKCYVIYKLYFVEKYIYI